MSNDQLALCMVVMFVLQCMLNRKTGKWMKVVGERLNLMQEQIDKPWKDDDGR